jgi:hypothetical protein
MCSSVIGTAHRKADACDGIEHPQPSAARWPMRPSSPVSAEAHAAGRDTSSKKRAVGAPPDAWHPRGVRWNEEKSGRFGSLGEIKVPGALGDAERAERSAPLPAETTQLDAETDGPC